MKMKLVRGTALDSLADYALVEAEAPRPGPGQVAVRVAACGIGYVDVLVALGGYQVKPPLPHTPGQEVAGTISGLGEGVAGLAVGDRVLAAVQGGFAEVAVAAAVAAFIAEPFYRHLFGHVGRDSARYRRLLADYFRYSFAEARRLGHLELAPAGSGVAAWLRPMPDTDEAAAATATPCCAPLPISFTDEPATWVTLMCLPAISRLSMLAE